MIKGIGIDIVKISRVTASYKKYGEKFLAKFLTKNEIGSLAAKNTPEHLGGIFAAKEATIKAVSGIVKKLPGFLDITIHNNAVGAPVVNLDRKKLKIDKKIKLHLSISHEQEYAVATVVCEK